jgi:hypothetical protein
MRSPFPSCNGFIESSDCNSVACCYWNEKNISTVRCDIQEGLLECNPQRYGTLMLMIGIILLAGIWICVMVFGQCHQLGGKFWEWCQKEETTPLLDIPRLKRCNYLKSLWKDKISALRNGVVDVNVDSIFADPRTFFREIKM